MTGSHPGIERASSLRVFFKPGPEVKRGVEGELPESFAVDRARWVCKGNRFQVRGKFGGRI